MKVDVAKAASAYGTWRRDLRSVTIEITDDNSLSQMGGYDVPPHYVWPLDLPPEVFDSDARLRGRIKLAGESKWRAIRVVWRGMDHTINLSVYPAPGDTVEISW